MSLTFAKLLEYLGVQELKDALREINESQPGTRPELAKRVYTKWLTYNRKVEDLLDFLDDETLSTICYDYNLGDEGNCETLKRRIKRDLNSNKPKSEKQENVESKKEITTNQRKYLTVGGIIAAVIVATTIASNFTTIIDFVEKRTDNQTNKPSIITSVNQSGGITADQVIINQKAPSRQLDEKFISELEKHLPSKDKSLIIVTVVGDSESLEFALEIKDYLESKGWFTERIDHTLFIRPVKGVDFSIRDDGGLTITVGSNS